MVEKEKSPLALDLTKNQKVRTISEKNTHNGVVCVFFGLGKKVPSKIYRAGEALRNAMAENNRRLSFRIYFGFSQNFGLTAPRMPAIFSL
jgi:hypothetical protein